MARKNKQPVLPSPSPSDEEDTAPTPPPPPPSALKPPRPNSEPFSSSEGPSSESEGSPPPPKKPAMVAPAPPPKKASPTPTKKVTSPPPPAQPSDTAAVAPERPEKKRKAPDTPMDDPNDMPSRNLFERVWTDHDVSVLMKGLLEFRQMHGHEPTCAHHHQVLLDMVKQRLHSEFTATQISTKIRNQKKKYTANLAKEKDVFRNDQDKLMFLLSKKIWGNLKAVKWEVSDDSGEEDSKNAGNNKAHKLWSVTASHRKKTNNGVAAVEDSRNADSRGVDSMGLKWAVKLITQDLTDGISSNHGMLERGLTLLDPEVLSAFGEEWKDMKYKEFCIWSKRNQLRSEVVRAVEEALTNASF